jgi:hypothetical protein
MRRRTLPALSLPRGRDDRRASALLSLLLHVAIVMLLVTPFAVHHVIVEQEQGAGGPGPAGGGGGGHGGTGGVTDQTEHIRFVRVAAAPANVPSSAVPEQVVPPPPTPVPPPEPIKVEPMPTPKIEAKLDIPAPSKVPDVAAMPGVGGGTGHDGTNGNGPGSGGGVGTGTGTGRGAGVGPGTGGGNQANYPPYPKETRLPPFPVPDNLHGSRIVAEFDVDSTGRVLGVDYNRTKNGDYNHRLEEALRGYRFNAGTRPDGRPIRMKAQVIITLP